MDWDGLQQLPEEIAAQIDLAGTWDVTEIRAYELVTIPAQGLVVKPLRPSVYVEVGLWEPEGADIEFPAPFDIRIVWEDLAF